jgi:separase
MGQTILSPRVVRDQQAVDNFRERVDRIFVGELTGGPDLKKAPRVRIDDTLLECFSSLSSKCKDEEVEDLVYFILDVYQFHGVPVALAELDIDQVGQPLMCAVMLMSTDRDRRQERSGRVGGCDPGYTACNQ